jgi:uncharacterized membrane protein
MNTSTDAGPQLIRKLGAEGGLSRSLAWFSIGVGTVQLLAPRTCAHMLGLPTDRRSRRIVRTRGLRELVTGVGLLNSDHPGFAWTRLAGDVLDLGLWASRWRSQRADGARLTGAMVATIGVAIVDAMALAAKRAAPEPTDIMASIRIEKEPGEVFRFWRRAENLSRFMGRLARVEPIDERNARWHTHGEGGEAQAWEVEIVEDEPDRLIAWRVRHGASIACSGVVGFVPAPGGRGTEVQVALHTHAASGTLGKAMARLFGESPRQELVSDLRRLKQVLETGEVVRSDSSREEARR